MLRDGKTLIGYLRSVDQFGEFVYDIIGVLTINELLPYLITEQHYSPGPMGAVYCTSQPTTAGHYRADPRWEPVW